MKPRALLATRLGPGHLEAVRQVLQAMPGAELDDLALTIAHACALGQVDAVQLGRYLVQHGLRKPAALRLVDVGEGASSVDVSLRHASVFSFGATEAPRMTLASTRGKKTALTADSGAGCESASRALLQREHVATVRALVDRNPSLPLTALATLVRQGLGLPSLCAQTLALFLQRHGIRSHGQRERSEVMRRASKGLRVATAGPTPTVRVNSVFELAARLDPSEGARS